MRSKRQLLRVLITSLLILTLRVAPASAHASLLSTSPSAGADLKEAPNDLQLTFDEEVRIPSNGIRMINEQAEAVEIGRLKVANAIVKMELPKLEPGAYVVSWRAVSLDGHPIRGAFTFRVGGTGNQQTVASIATKLLSAQSGQGAIGIVLAALRTLNFSFFLLLIGLVAYIIHLRMSIRGGDRPALVVAGAAKWGAVVAGIVTVALYGPYVSGQSFSAVTDGVLLDDTIHDRVGRAILLRTILLFGLGTLVTRGLRQAAPETAESVSEGQPARLKKFAPLLAATAAVLATQLFAGHALVGPLPVVSAVSTVLHVLGAGAWIGGLVVLAIVVLRNRAISDGDALAISGRYSTMATASVVAIVVSGLFASWRQVGGTEAATSTTFGRLVMAKVLLVGILLLFGSMNRRAVRSGGQGGSVRAKLTKSVVIESTLALVVVAVTALLVNAAPGREVVARPVTFTISTGAGPVDTTVEPARKGRNEIHLYALQPDGLPLEIQDMTATAQLPSAGVEPITLRLVRAGTNHFQAIDADLPIPGDWRIDIKVRIDEFEEVSGSASFAIR